MSLNFDLAGKTYDSELLEISAESIAAYAAASRIVNPMHDVGEGQVPSAIYPVVIGLPLMAVVTTDPELNLENPLMIVHGEEEIVHYRPMKPGESLIFTPSLESVEDKGSGGTYVARVTGATPDGEAVNDQYATIIVRGSGIRGEQPPG